MKSRVVFCVILCCLFLSGCKGEKESGSYVIGIDPSWYPLELAGQEKNVLAFSIELLKEIAKREALEMSLVMMNWDNLLWGLREGKYRAALSTLEPYIFYQDRYSFSNLYLMTGPVLVVPKNSDIHSLKDLEGKEVGVVRGSSAALLLQKYPGVIIHGFNSAQEEFTALQRKKVDATLLDILIAQNFIRDLYRDTFKIATPPITSRGLRLVSLFDKAPTLLKKFDAGLKKLHKDKTYEQLLKKWGLSPDSKPSKELSLTIDQFLQTRIRD